MIFELNWNSIVNLHINSIISRNRWWRIKLCDDICDNVQFECDENEKHIFFISLKMMYEKLQRTIFFAMRFRFDLFLQRWKTFDWFYNFDYFNIYYMLRCNENVIAIAVYFKMILIALTTFFFENSNLWLIENLIKQRTDFCELC